VLDPFAAGARIRLRAPSPSTVAVGVRMLDNVLDVTAWPLPQQQREAMQKRRVGLGSPASATR
jgi:ribonucleoside-diphosphate reductase alpha chain